MGVLLKIYRSASAVSQIDRMLDQRRAARVPGRCESPTVDMEQTF
jgi:hypothetical protein